MKVAILVLLAIVAALLVANLNEQRYGNCLARQAILKDVGSSTLLRGSLDEKPVLAPTGSARKCRRSPF